MERVVRNAAKALIIKDDKMLAIKISDGKEEWYIMPGGGQDVEELLPETVCREVAEEMGLQIEAKDLAFVIEGLHGEKFHRVDLVFLCEYKGKIENAVLQGGDGFSRLSPFMMFTLQLYHQTNALSIHLNAMRRKLAYNTNFPPEFSKSDD